MPSDTPTGGAPRASGPDPALSSVLLDFAKTHLPQYCPLDLSDLHRHILARRAAKTAQPLATRKGQLDVILAPRNSAKSTWLSLLAPLHAALTGAEPYILILAATQEMAKARIANLRQALEAMGLEPTTRRKPRGTGFQPVTQFHTPHPTDPSDTSDTSYKSDRFPKSPLRIPHFFHATSTSLELNNCRIEARSAGSEIRGLLFGPHRPSWIILDDAERSDRVAADRHRERTHAWFCEVVENLGATHTNIDLVGTLLHPDALPARLLARASTHGRVFQSIISESANPDLWQQWRDLFHNFEDPARADTARTFYERNQAAMDQGAQVLWPASENYYDLNVRRETIGNAAFDKEKQNAPESTAAGVFRADKIAWFHRDGDDTLVPESDRAVPADPKALRVFGFLDPATGSLSGDYAAIVVVGLSPQRFIFVLEAWLAKVPPSDQIARIYDLHARYRFEQFGIETNAFQRMYLDHLETERERRRAAGLPFDLHVENRPNSRRKLDRILALEPLFNQHRVLLDRDLGDQFLRQLDEFPRTRHDDAPDALAGAVELATAAQPIPLKRLRRLYRAQTPQLM